MVYTFVEDFFWIELYSIDLRTMFFVTLSRTVDLQQFIIKKQGFNHHKHNKERAPPLLSSSLLVKWNDRLVSNICYMCFLSILLCFYIQGLFIMLSVIVYSCLMITYFTLLTFVLWYLKFLCCINHICVFFIHTC